MFGLIKRIITGEPLVVGVADQFGKEAEKGLRVMFERTGTAVTIFAVACVPILLAVAWILFRLGNWIF